MNNANPNLASVVPYTDAGGNAKSYAPFNFGSTGGLEQKADNTVLGNMMDCGECHVGGGAMEYVPKYQANGAIGSPMAGTASPANRVPLRTATQSGGFLNGLFSAFNWFIDVFGPKGDGKGATYTAMSNDFAQSGVLEMDCMACHLDGYSWENRRDAVRARGFDASRAFGANFAVYSTGATPSRTVKYDPVKVVFANGSSVSGGFKLASDVAQKINGVPPANNCASCHFATLKEKYQVEWKKRGEFWGGSEVHLGIGCMGCHERKDLNADGSINTANVGTSGIANSTAPNNLLGMCDPAKGAACDYDAQWNAMDNVAFKKCDDCHTSAGSLQNGRSYGAPNADAAHAARGLTTAQLQGGKSHLQVLDCSTCHTRKLKATVALYDENNVFRTYTSFPISGGAMVDGTGKDEQGRLAVHDAEEVARDMQDNLALYWKGGKMYLGNLLTSMFWRDMNGLLDINNDGRGPGLDPLLQTHMARLNEAGGFEALTKDGVVTPAEITTASSYIAANIKTLLGSASTETPVIKLSALGVPFKATHNIARASDAWGAKGCTDCHSAGSNFYNGGIAISPKTNFDYGANQAVNFTKVNGLTQATDVHPQVVDKAGVRSVAVPIFNTAGGSLTTKAVKKSELIYETTFMARDTAWKASITGAARPAPGAANSPWYDANATVPGTTVTAGWTMKLEAKSDSDGTITERTFVVTSGTLATVDALLTHMGTAFTTNQPEFTITGIDTNADLVNDAIKIDAKAGFTIRLTPQCDVGPFGLTNALWVNQPLVGTDGNSYATRAAYTGYLDAIGDFNAEIATVGGTSVTGNPASVTVTRGTAAALAATKGGALADAKYEYTWAFGDGTTDQTGQSVSHTFATNGTFAVKLTVKNVMTGDQKVDYQDVKVVDPAPTNGVTPDVITYNVPSAGYASIPLIITGTAVTRVYVVWGDGGTQNIYTTSPNPTISHKFYGYPTKKAFTAKVYVYNGGTLAAKNESIAVTFP